MFNNIGALATGRPRLLLLVAVVFIALGGVLGSGVESRVGDPDELRSKDGRHAIVAARAAGDEQAVAIGSSRIAKTQMLGLGVALAVLVDATVVRTTFVPAFMAPTVRWTWWTPRPLRHLHARVGWHEGGPAPLVAAAAAGATTGAGTTQEPRPDRVSPGAEDRAAAVPVLAAAAEER